MPENSHARVAICIGTFRREELLRELLCGIAKLTFTKVAAPQIQIAVVDNDAAGSAEQVCRTTVARWPVKYVVEPRRGITYARNRAIAETNDADFVAFIDDDEIPCPNWLDELLSVQARFSAGVVSGPVLPRYASDVPTWIKHGKFFEPPVLVTGTERLACATNNVLISRHVFNQVPAFDDSFALSGAEDTDFFLRVVQAGYKIVWSPQACVFETISRSRANLAWILRREYQTGNGWVFCETVGAENMRAWPVRFAKACGHVVLGLGGVIWSSLLLNKIAAVHSLRRMTLGLGMIAALAGHRFLAYQRVNVQRTSDAELT